MHVEFYSTHYSLLTTHYSLLTTHYSLLTTHHSLLTTHYSLLTTHYSLLTTHYSLLLTTHYSLLTPNTPLVFKIKIFIYFSLQCRPKHLFFFSFVSGGGVFSFGVFSFPGGKKTGLKNFKNLLRHFLSYHPNF